MCWIDKLTDKLETRDRWFVFRDVPVFEQRTTITENGQTRVKGVVAFVPWWWRAFLSILITTCLIIVGVTFLINR